MNELSIPSQIINPVTSSILSMPNNILNTNVETSTRGRNDLRTCASNDDDIACSNSEFDLRVGDSSYFMDSAEKDDAVNCVNTLLIRIELRKTMMLRIVLRKTIDTQRNCAQDA